MAGAADFALGPDAACAATDRSTTEVQDLARRATYVSLVRRESTIALGVARRMVGDPGAAEDLVQEAFLRAWRHLDRLAPDIELRPWFYRVLINACRDRLRRRIVRRRKPLPSARPQQERCVPDPVAAAEGRELQERVDAAVERLPLRQRECLLLRTRANLSYREMAELLKITEGAVKGHLFHARSTLLRRLRAEVGEGGLPR